MFKSRFMNQNSSFKSRNFLKISSSEASGILRFALISLLSHLKNILVSISSLRVTGIVGRLLFNFYKIYLFNHFQIEIIMDKHNRATKDNHNLMNDRNFIKAFENQ